ncbi:MAG: hypothetical protein JST59_25690 [Actinobacteria bacterium]|nr:hypothetical protein [Actinomycetota bacterium]
MPGAAVTRRRGQRPGHSATTAHFQAAYPFQGQGGLGAPGVYIGADAFGGAWVFDQWELYERRIMRSPNIVVLGEIAFAKSTWIKTFLYRQYLFGRQSFVIDIKGEYWPLAEAIGVSPFVLAPGGSMRLNPIERRGGRKGQLALLRSVATAALRRHLVPEEEAGLRVALDQCNDEAGSTDPTLPNVVDVLLHPREPMIAGVSAAGGPEFAAANRELALALQRLCDGDLRGIFDGQTSAGIDLESPLIVFDLSAMGDSEALGVLATCVGAWQQAVLRERKRVSDETGVPMRKAHCVFEEVWQVTPNIGVAEWLQANFKLCRALAISNILSTHKLTDFDTAGDKGSRAVRIAQNLVPDAGCFIIHRQSPDQREVLRDDLGRSETEVELAMGLDVGEALWVMGAYSTLVQQRSSAREREITFTDQQMGALPSRSA